MKALVSRALFLALVVSCASSCSKKEEGAPTGDIPDNLGTANAGQAVVNRKDLDKLVDLIVAEAQELPRPDFDPAALARKLGKNPNVHFEWVRDQTWWAPYRGLLRGSKGVMLDRVGSNLDRAVLLGDLLRNAGHTVRLAHAQLPEGRARELLRQMRPFPDQRRSASEQKPFSAQRQRQLEAIIPGEEKAFQEQVTDSRRRLADAETLARSQAERLYAKVKGAENLEERGDSHVIAALRDHWWVERKENGRWIGMDVLLPTARAGEALASASSVSEWESGAALPSIPDGDWHTVGVRVVVERYDGAVTAESTVLETTLRAAEVLERPITLFHKPHPWPEMLPDVKDNPNALGDAAANVKEWVPVLQVGYDFVVQSGFSESGDLIADPLNSQRDIAATGGGGFMSGFGEALGGDVAASSSVTAEWIDYDIHVPGQPVQRVRRPLFDVLGPVNRAAKASDIDAGSNDLLVERYEALLSNTDILLQPCNFTEAFVADLLSKSLVANQAAIREFARERDAARAGALASTILERIESWGPLPDLVVWRSVLGDRTGAWFIDRPNVLNYRVALPVVNADHVAVRQLIDIATNATGIRQDSEVNSFEVRVRQGVADTVAEILVLGGEVRVAENAAALFGMNDRDVGDDVLIGSRALKTGRELDWPADAAARLAEDVDAGYMVVATRQPVLINERQRVGWWRVDPKSGETIGVMDSGYHADTSEEAVLWDKIQALRNFLLDNRQRIRAARRAIRRGNATPAQREFIRDVVEVVEDALSGAVPPPVP